MDTLRRDALSLYGGPTPTPALDALDADSIVFDRAAQRYFEQRYPEFLGIDPPPERISEYGAQWVRNHKSAPFLFWLHFFDPHSPYDPVEQFPPPYQPSDRLAALNPAQMENALRYGPRLPGLTQWARALYQSEVQNIDQAVGAFLQDLKKQGV